MFLECFLPDPYNAPSWGYDVPKGQRCLIVGIMHQVEEVIARTGMVRLIGIPIKDRLEGLAEEMLAQAADGNKPATAAEVKKRYEDVKDLDVEFGRLLNLRGQTVAVPQPEWLGRYASNAESYSNLVLYNPAAVIPVLLSS